MTSNNMFRPAVYHTTLSKTFSVGCRDSYEFHDCLIEDKRPFFEFVIRIDKTFN